MLQVEARAECGQTIKRKIDPVIDVFPNGLQNLRKANIKSDM